MSETLQEGAKPLLIGWSIGSGYGHLAQVRPVVSGLRALGVPTLLSVPDPALLARFGGADWGPVVAGPPPPPGVARSVTEAQARSYNLPITTYADVLSVWGFDTPAELTRTVTPWLDLIDRHAPAAVAAHHAPALHLAAVLRGLPVVRFGDGFVVPPADADRLPPLSFWAPPGDAQCQASEEPVLASINAVLSARGRPPLTSLSAFLRLAEDYLMTWPQLDHYGPRPDGFYYGPLGQVSGGAAASWPDAAGPRVAIYLSAGHPDSPAVIEALRRLGWPAAMHSPRKPDLVFPDNLSFSSEPYDLARVISQANVVVCHTPHGTSALCIAAGRPVVALPLDQEQQMVAARLAALGLAVVPPPAPTADAIVAALDAAAAPAIAQRAAHAAGFVAGYDAAQAASDLAEDMLASLRAAGAAL